MSTRQTIVAAVLCFAIGFLAGRLCRSPAASAYLPPEAWDGVVEVDSLEHTEVDPTHFRLKVTTVAVEGEKAAAIFAGGNPDAHPYRVRLPDGRTSLYCVRLAE
jgi:hypothetical protein